MHPGVGEGGSFGFEFARFGAHGGMGAGVVDQNDFVVAPGCAVDRADRAFAVLGRGTAEADAAEVGSGYAAYGKTFAQLVLLTVLRPTRRRPSIGPCLVPGRAAAGAATTSRADIASSALRSKADRLIDLNLLDHRLAASRKGNLRRGPSRRKPSTGAFTDRAQALAPSCAMIAATMATAGTAGSTDPRAPAP
jgi:hypothetical protein